MNKQQYTIIMVFTLTLENVSKSLCRWIHHGVQLFVTANARRSKRARECVSKNIEVRALVGSNKLTGNKKGLLLIYCTHTFMYEHGRVMHFTWNRDRKLSIQWENSDSLNTGFAPTDGMLPVESLIATRGPLWMRSTQGRDGCCQAIQHWWNRLLGLVSNEFSIFSVSRHLTNL